MSVNENIRIGVNYIAGEQGKVRLDWHDTNPATGEDIGYFPLSNGAEINRAVDSANEAFKEWGNPSKWSWVKRAEVIDDLVQLVKADKEGLAHLVTMESGKHIDEARADVEEGIHMLQYCVSRGRLPIGSKIPCEIPEKESEIYLMPRGVCTVITPWNFPFAIPTWLIGPALVSGCPVIFKPSEETPLSGQELVHLFHVAAKKHNVPKGVLNLVHGLGDVGEKLVRHKGTVGQLFTGSYSVGSKIKQIVAAHHDKFAVCEMGGKNSLIILKDANMELAVRAAVLSAFKTTHQRCVSSDLIIVEESVEPEVTKLFVQMTQQLRFGNPLDPNVFAGPLINADAIEKHFSNTEKIKNEAETVLYPWRVHYGKGFYVYPHVFRMKYRPNSFSLKEEFFTPNVVIVPVKDFEEALFVANDTDYGLSMALFSEDRRKEREFKIRGRAGLKYFNDTCIGAEVQKPFGGLKKSGTGMPSAAWLFNHLCHETAFTVNYGTEIKMAQGMSAKV